MSERPSRAPIRVLFVCVENACQSQMAEGWLRALGDERFAARSAGTQPRHLHPLATRAMDESGIHIAAQRGKGLDAVRHERFDVVVTLDNAVREALPEFRGRPETEHHEVADPTWLEDEDGADLDEFRTVRDELRALVEQLVARLT